MEADNSRAEQKHRGDETQNRTTQRAVDLAFLVDEDEMTSMEVFFFLVALLFLLRCALVAAAGCC